MVITRELSLHTQGNCDVQDITPQVQGALRDSGLQAGIATVFCPGSTGGLTTIEYESGVVAARPPVPVLRVGPEGVEPTPYGLKVRRAASYTTTP